MVKRRDERFPYIPKHQEKYMGNVPIMFRSKWERDYSMLLDFNPQVERWSYEPHWIPYLDPVLKRRRYYLPDFDILYTDGRNEVVEFKPKKQTFPPKPNKRKRKKTIIREEQNWARNTAKWESAQKFCKRTGKEFKIVTEESLGYYKAQRVKKKLGRKNK